MKHCKLEREGNKNTYDASLPGGDQPLGDKRPEEHQKENEEKPAFGKSGIGSFSGMTGPVMTAADMIINDMPTMKSTPSGAVEWKID